MKGYILSFCIVLAALLLSTLSFLAHNMEVVHSIPGIALAAIALRRMRYVRNKGLDERRHALAMVCGWVFFFVVLAGPVFVDDYPLYSMAIMLGWGLAIMMACLFHRYRSVAAGAVSVAVWLAFVCFAVPAWQSYCQELRDSRAANTGQSVEVQTAGEADVPCVAG